MSSCQEISNNTIHSFLECVDGVTNGRKIDPDVYFRKSMGKLNKITKGAHVPRNVGMFKPVSMIPSSIRGIMHRSIKPLSFFPNVTRPNTMGIDVDAKYDAILDRLSVGMRASDLDFLFN
jgi:hypothetical protein